MKTSTHVNLLVALFVAGACGAAQANVIFTDTFDDETTGAWYSGGDLGTLTAMDTGEQLSWTPDDATGMRQVIGRSFSTQSLGVGDWIEFTFDYTRTAGNLGILRVGLFHLEDPIAANDWANDSDNAWSGYYTFIRDNGTNVARVYNQDGMAVPGSDAPGALNGPTFAGTNMTVTEGGGANTSVALNTQYQGSYRVTRTETGIETLFTFSDGATTLYSVAANTTTTWPDFNTVAIRVSEGTVLFDNMRVTVVPEPGDGGYADWSDGAPFDGDKNSDGVPNGLAWVLGAESPDDDARDLLPTVVTAEDEGEEVLILAFQRRRAALDEAEIVVEYNTDLTDSEGWADAEDDEDSIIITETPNGLLDEVAVRIKTSVVADGGRLFLRLRVTQLP